MIVYMSHSVYEIDFTNQLNLLDSASFIYKIAHRLSEKKRACWVAGGAVRDFWLGRTPKDIDLVTDAEDAEILELFPKAVLVGQKFGVYKLPFHHEGRNIIIDLTVFRDEDNYVDGRRPQTIKRATPLEDAKRRDFTINALFYDLENFEVIDYVGGVEDLQNKVLKCVGDANRRLNEDHLRLLRLARFKAQFGFSVPAADLQAATNLSDLIRTVSGERIYEEVLKIVNSHSEVDFWSQELTQKLWFSLGAEINPDQLAKIPLLKQTAFSVNQQLVMSVVVLWKYAPETVEFLKARLKCSKEEAQFAKKAIDYHVEVAKGKAALDMALTVDTERDRDMVLNIFEFFAASGDCLQTYLADVKQYLKTHPKPLLTGGDLVGKCEPAKTLTLLQLVRRMQFEKKIRTSDEALVYLKNQNLIS